MITTKQRLILLLALLLVLGLAWSEEFDPYCWEFNAKIHKICYTSGFYGVCYR